jgi:hypothetical protein
VQTLSLPIAGTIRECVATLATYAFSKLPMQAWADKWLHGEFGQLRHTMFELPAQRAERACLELAVLLRYLDDERGISDSYRGHSEMDFGRLHGNDGSVKQLELRDVANKIIHATHFAWDLSDPERPYIVAFSRDEERWVRAEVNVAALCVVCGGLLA